MIGKIYHIQTKPINLKSNYYSEFLGLIVFNFKELKHFFGIKTDSAQCD